MSRYGEAEIACLEALLSRSPSRTLLRTSEDSLLYSVSQERFERLLSLRPRLARTLSASVGERLRRATLELSRAEPSLGSTTSPVDTLLTRPLVSIPAAAPIAEAARVMHEQRVSALVVTGSPSLGIVTDRDLRNRVLAEGRSPQQPIAAVMSTPTVTIAHDGTLFEALLLMLERTIHHLVVTLDGHPMGVLLLKNAPSTEQNELYIDKDIMVLANPGALRVSYRIGKNWFGVSGIVGSSLSQQNPTKEYNAVFGANLFGSVTATDWLSLLAEGYLARNGNDMGLLVLSSGIQVMDAGGYVSAHFTINPMHQVWVTAGGAVVLNPSKLGLGYTPATMDAAAARSGIGGMEHNVNLRATYILSPMKGLQFYLEPFLFLTRHKLAAADDPDSELANQVAFGGQLGTRYSF